MEFVIGALVGAGVLAVVIAFSMARAAKEADETETSLIKDRVAQIKSKLHSNGDDE